MTKPHVGQQDTQCQQTVIKGLAAEVEPSARVLTRAYKLKDWWRGSLNESGFTSTPTACRSFTTPFHSTLLVHVSILFCRGAAGRTALNTGKGSGKSYIVAAKVMIPYTLVNKRMRL